MQVAESELNAGDTGVVDSSSIIIIHPGSRYLRIGRASDTAPKRILHAVARKRRKPAIKVIFVSEFDLNLVTGVFIFIFSTCHFHYFLYLIILVTGCHVAT